MKIFKKMILTNFIIIINS